MVAGGTDNHLLLVDVKASCGISGKKAQRLLDEINITANKNAIPFDTEKPFKASGIRIGTPAMTTKGFKEEDFEEVARIIAYRLKNEGKKVLLAAGDTFRAGAVDQLEIWAKKVGVDIVIKKGATDPSSVIFEAIQKAKNEKYDILLCDTAGRLQNKTNLMKELEKMHRVIAREVEGAPQETLLVIDATTGQNGISQAKQFKEITNITGIVLTKLDGTSKGGIVLAIRDKYNLPIKMVGLGEKMEDLEYFDLEDYIAGLFIDNGDEDGE